MSDRLAEIVSAAAMDWRERHYATQGYSMEQHIMSALRAAGVTLPPQPAGPVTSEEAFYVYAGALHHRDGTYCAPDEYSPADVLTERHAIDAAMPLLARDHGLLTPAEVERRAREWADDYNLGPAHESALVAALTAPADTSAASTREAK